MASARELEALWKLIALIRDGVDRASLVTRVLDDAIALVKAERGFMILFSASSPAAERFKIAAARNLDREEVLHAEFKFSRSIVQLVADRGAALLIPDATKHPLSTAESVVALALLSIVCVPLRANGRTFGVLYVDHRHLTEFGPEDLAILEVFATPAAILIEAAQREEELRKSRDELARQVTTIERLRAEASERYRQRSRELDRLRDGAPWARGGDASASEELPGIVSRSSAMRRVAALVRKAAPSDAPVLIVGESGTGKELVARALHALSPRSQRRFAAENCAAVSELLLESELFGHEIGAFTGATKQHRGVFETTDGGTLFLDEVGEMSSAFQSKLLRVLQEQRIRRVGGQDEIAVDVRVIAATHRNLEAMVAQGTFRSDLYYRINVVKVELPPLRERIEDLPALIEQFLERFGKGARVEATAREILLAHSWPGNVRELENEIRRALLLAGPGGAVGPAMLSPHVLGRSTEPRAAPTGEPPDQPIVGIWRLDELERAMIERALRFTNGNKSAAARLLGVPKTTLYNRLERHDRPSEP